MKKVFKNIKNNSGREKICLPVILFLFTAIFSCKEQGRFEIGYSDSEPPDMPVCLGYEPLYGGAKIRFRIPEDEDLLSIDASYINSQGRTVWFSASYYHDTINVYGFSDTLEHTVSLYAVDRAGNRSEALPVPVKPLEPAYTRIAKSIVVKPGFASLFMDWTNELRQNINVYADLSYTKNGEYTEHRLIYTSNVLKERWTVRDLELGAQEPVSLKIRVEDYYGNITEYIDRGNITLLQDEMIPKDKWTMPEEGTYFGDEPMGYFSANEGRVGYLIDGIVDDGKNMNYGHTGHVGHTGLDTDVNLPWNVMINLGDEYELSRIVTHQRYYSGTESIRGQYYMAENVGTYKLYIYDEPNERWDSVSRHTIPFVEGLSDMEYRQTGMAGDMAYFYPDDPKFTSPTRWFRYEALYAFGKTTSDWRDQVHCLSEITLYGRKK
jgi:hypothetical protein